MPKPAAGGRNFELWDESFAVCAGMHIAHTDNFFSKYSGPSCT